MNTETTTVQEQELNINNVRATAVMILSRFERSDAYLNKLLEHELKEGKLIPQDKALLTEIVSGVIRWRWKLDWVLTGFYHGDYLKCLNIVKNALRTALYQILFLDKIPSFAAINETVEIVKRIQGEKTAGIVNGVLRNIVRNINNIRYPDEKEDLVYYLTIIHSHPRWMVKVWLDRYGEEETIQLLNANNQRPYTPIRINRLRTDSETIKEYLKENKFQYYLSPFLKESIILKSARADISSLDIFKEGLITVQDTSAMLATLLAAPKEGQTVIDLCAAPGGKSFCLAELMNDCGRVIAIDKYASKLRFIEEGALRMGLKSITILAGDASEIEFDGLADIIYADVPCSGLGTISKKPDIKWKREREDIPAMAELQKKILANAARLTIPGGILVYSTCTIEPEENIENIKWFLAQYPNFELDPAEKYLPERVCSEGFMQTLPHIHNIDGAFAARLVRKLKK